MVSLAVLAVVRENHHHTFQLLTKNPKRLLKFDFPSNMWLGVSMPPSQMNGRVLTPFQQERYMVTALRTLSLLKSRGHTTFISFEPLSFDVAPIVARYQALSWAIIGAASRGYQYYQPDPEHLKGLLAALDEQGTRIFYKGNLHPSIPTTEWREEFPD